MSKFKKGQRGGMEYTAREVAEKLEGETAGDPDVVLSGFAPAGNARQGDLTFAENGSFFAKAEQSPAAAILVDADYGPSSKTLIRVRNARIGFAKALPLFFPEPEFGAGVHPTAAVAESASVDGTAYVGPHCIVADGAKVGARCVLRGHVYVGEQCQLGEEVHLFPNVTLYPRSVVGNRVRIHAGAVVGADGFGYVLDEGEHRKVPQIGHVILQDDVEIGANVTIDRGALGPTVIGRGTKVDNLVQIAHNVSTGEHCLVVAQTGVAGSTKLGNYVTLAGQVGLAGHLKIGNRAIVAAQSGVMHDIPEGEKWFGSPAQPDRKMKRQLLAMHQLPALLKRIQDLERQLKEAVRKD